MLYSLLHISTFYNTTFLCFTITACACKLTENKSAAYIFFPVSISLGVHCINHEVSTCIMWVAKWRRGRVLRAKPIVWKLWMPLKSATHRSDVRETNKFGVGSSFRCSNYSFFLKHFCKKDLLESFIFTLLYAVQRTLSTTSSAASYLR